MAVSGTCRTWQAGGHPAVTCGAHRRGVMRDIVVGGGTVQVFIKRGFGRYAALVIGFGAAGLAIGWIGHDLGVGMSDR